MARLLRKQSLKSGMPPGSIINVGSLLTPTTMEYIRYNDSSIKILDANDLSVFRDMPDAVDWIHIQGLSDTDRIIQICQKLKVHFVLIEDIFNDNQRAKTEDLEDGVFVVLKFPVFDEEEGHLHMEQASMILSGNMVISFQSSQEPIFTPLKDRLYKAAGKIRKLQADYLLYALCDLVVDSYFAVLESIDDTIEALEEKLVGDPTQETLQKIYHLKQETIVLRRAVWPMREAVGTLNRTDNPIVNESTHIYLRDLYDHTIQVIDTVETFRDMISGMLDMYLTSISNKMNEVMKVLTIFASIFIPLTFLAGVYGMNFHFLPELGWKWAYPVWWGVTIIVGLAMLAYFKRKNWL
ncbi:MAG TPA: magnesium/cobalt transporter CorA [Candidatus Cloacimonadota bacterium]|nr:magnesium/cobalt transporter CorA [Candidatus Cloacimonadota bacterium]